MSDIKVTVVGRKRVIKHLEDLTNYEKNPIFKKHTVRAKKSVKSFWADNVYTVFNKRERMGLANSGKLGKACTIRHQSPTIIDVGMKKLSRGHNGISGGPARDYGYIIMNGSSRGVGMYNRAFDLKIPKATGSTPGVRTSYGNSWRRKLTKECKEIYTKAADDAIKEINK